MPWLPTATVVGVVVLIALLVLYLRLRAQDQLDAIMTRRKGSSRLVSRAHFVEGMERIAVCLSLSADSVNYENADLQASLGLEFIEEVEYDDETATGHTVVGKALRLRSHGQTFEFIVDHATARQWSEVLPPRHYDEARAV